MHFYILAGGKSRRFGQNKALFIFNGRAIIERIITAIPTTAEIFLVTNSPNEYTHLKLSVIPDQYPGCGPLAGIHAGLAHSPHEWNFFLACDFPNLQTSTITEILAAPRAAQVILPQTTEGLQPLCALWSRTTLPIIETALQKREYRVQKALAHLNFHLISLSDSRALLNLNTPGDLAELQNPFH